MIDLLECVSLQSRNNQKLLAISLPVNPDLAPYLVSSASREAYIPVRKCRSDGNIMAGVRSLSSDRSSLYRSAVLSCLSLSEQFQWGSSFKTLEEAKSYVLGYGIPVVDVLYQRGFSCSEGQEVDWLPFQGAIVIPKDRAFLGSLILLRKGSQFASVIHNPARGIAFYR